MLIAYGDQIAEPGKAPAAALRDWVDRHLEGVVGTVHLLPFYPYSSDDGFSVIDYRRIAPEIGDWQDICRLGDRFALMFDAVINHISAKSDWFRGFLAGRPPYRDFFPAFDPAAAPDLTGVTRPRTTPLLHRFDTPDGVRSVWTTFSDDQIDLDYANPDLLFEIVDLLLFYVARGARLIRLDAVSYLWKQPGTTLYQPAADPWPASDCCAPSWIWWRRRSCWSPRPMCPMPRTSPISATGGTKRRWFTNSPCRRCCWMPCTAAMPAGSGNGRRVFRHRRPKRRSSTSTATHDGIGLRPVADLMPADEVAALVEQARARGAEVSARALPDGGESPYELNITFFDALLAPGDDPAAPLSLDRYLTAQAVALSLAGIPAVYFHNLFGTRNDRDGFANTGRARSLNRRRFSVSEIESMLSDEASRERRIFDRYTALLRVWRRQPAFDPSTSQRVLDAPDAVLAVQRGSETPESVVALHNLSDSSQSVAVDASARAGSGDGALVDLISGRRFEAEGSRIDLTLAPYEMLWLTGDRAE